MIKIAINVDYGGFSLSKKAIELLKEKGVCLNRGCTTDRSNMNLIEVIELLGKESWGDFAKLEVIEIPEGVEWQIEEYDGKEWVAEKHRIWCAD